MRLGILSLVSMSSQGTIIYLLFFIKGKAMCYKAMKTSNRFTTAFARLDEEWDLDEEL